jgi:hypothetical protein
MQYNINFPIFVSFFFLFISKLLNFSFRPPLEECSAASGGYRGRLSSFTNTCNPRLSAHSPSSSRTMWRRQQKLKQKRKLQQRRRRRRRNSSDSDSDSYSDSGEEGTTGTFDFSSTTLAQRFSPFGGFPASSAAAPTAGFGTTAAAQSFGATTTAPTFHFGTPPAIPCGTPATTDRFSFGHAAVQCVVI